jgi:K+-sensing histidine kinase KdpD
MSVRSSAATRFFTTSGITRGYSGSNVVDQYVSYVRRRIDKPWAWGLAIVRTIIVAHGGSVAASNQPTGGGLVSFDLPLSGPVQR